jgi:hypothetical protein
MFRKEGGADWLLCMKAEDSITEGGAAQQDVG